MAAKTRDELKARFKVGDKPTAQDFIDLVDSMMLTSNDIVCLNDDVVVLDESVVSLT